MENLKVERELKRWFLNNRDTNIHHRIETRRMYTNHYLVLQAIQDKEPDWKRLESKNSIGDIKQVGRQIAKFRKL